MQISGYNTSNQKRNSIQAGPRTHPESFQPADPQDLPTISRQVENQSRGEVNLLRVGEAALYYGVGYGMAGALVSASLTGVPLALGASVSVGEMALMGAKAGGAFGVGLAIYDAVRTFRS